MISIIREGITPESQLYIHQCNTCKTVFTFTKIDTKFVSDYRDDSGSHYEFKCPKCKHFLYVEKLRAVIENDPLYVRQFLIECDTK